MDWLIDWLIDYWNLQKQVWWEFAARKNAGITEKVFAGNFYRESFRGKFWKVLQKVLQEKFNGKKSFTGEMGNQVWIETWKVADPSQLQLRVTDLLAPPDLPNFLT